MMKKITIMTPTFNRAYKILNLYKSLLRQKNKDFEWLIIDDGSTDNTEKIIQDILGDKIITIRYYKICNSGKHKAVNYSLDLAEGDYFFIVDSDDFLTDDAVETVFKWFKSIDGDNSFAGIGGLRKIMGSRVNIGTSFNGEFLDCIFTNRERFNITGDKAEVYYTDILRKYRFPEFENEKFLSESVLWNKIAEDGYKIRWINTPIYECEYLDDGLTNNLFNHYKSSPKGFALYLKSLIRNSEISFVRKHYYYGMYYCVVQPNSLKKTKDIFGVFSFQLLFGIFFYKLVQMVKRRNKK